MCKLISILIITLIALKSSSVSAYIGPGMSGGIIAATLGIVIAIFAALLGILYYPIKRYLKHKKQNNKTNEHK